MQHLLRWRTLTFVLSLILLTNAVTSGQSPTASISGHIADNSHAVIPNARIFIMPGNLVRTSDGTGSFSVTGLAPGNYTVTISSPGFAQLVKNLSLSAGEAAAFDAVLQVGSSNQQVTVTGETTGPEQTVTQAINQEITSANMVNVMPYTQIISLPNGNVSDAIGRLPDVTLQRNEGQGEYVQVRGLDPRLTLVTVDDVTLPAPEVVVQQVDLTTIPDDMVASIVVNKTLSATQDAGGIGGSVNLVTKTAGARPYFTAESTMGYTPIMNTRYVGKVSTTAGMSFGANKRWGLIGGFEEDYNGAGIDNIQPSPDVNPNGSTTPYYDNDTQRMYRFKGYRWGYTSTLDFKKSQTTNFALHFLLSDFHDWLDKWYYEMGPKTKFYESDQVRTPEIGSLILNGSHIYKNSWVQWSSAVSRSRFLNAGGDPVAEWDPVSSLKDYDKANCNYIGTPTSIYRPKWSPGCELPNANPADNNFNPDNYVLSSFRTTSGKAVELDLQENGRVGMNYHLGSHPATFQFGGEFRNEHAFENAYTPTYDLGTAASQVTMTPFLSGFDNKNYYDGTYYMGPVTVWSKLANYAQANPGQFTLDEGETQEASQSADFNLVQHISAGYVMNTINWPRFSLQTGFRVEAVQVRALGYYVQTDANGNWLGTTPETSTQSQVVPLPSVQARWELTPMTILRANYSRGYAPPNPYDLVPYVLDNGEGSIPRYSIGNPNEKATTANNYDLTLQRELRPFGIIQAGYYYKQLYNPIVQVYTSCEITGSLCNIPGQTINTDDGLPNLAQQDINISNAQVWGLEFDWRQNMTYLPGALRGMQMIANYSYADSHSNGIPGSTYSPPLIGTSRNAFNFEPGYELGRYSVHMGMTFNSDYDDAYQWFNNQADPANDTAGPANGPLGDSYAYSHLQIDAQMGMRVWRKLHLVLNGLNLTNEVFGYYNGQPQYVNQREYYKPTYSASLRWSSGSE